MVLGLEVVKAFRASNHIRPIGRNYPPQSMLEKCPQLCHHARDCKPPRGDPTPNIASALPASDSRVSLSTGACWRWPAIRRGTTRCEVFDEGHARARLGCFGKHRTSQSMPDVAPA